VCGTDSTVKIWLVTVQNVTTLLVSVSVSVWNSECDKIWAGDSADWYSVVGVC
jgi:hypothetical protein